MYLKRLILLMESLGPKDNTCEQNSFQTDCHNAQGLSLLWSHHNNEVQAAFVVPKISKDFRSYVSSYSRVKRLISPLTPCPILSSLCLIHTHCIKMYTLAKKFHENLTKTKKGTIIPLSKTGKVNGKL